MTRNQRGLRAVVAAALAGLLSGCPSPRVEVGVVPASHLEPLPGLPMVVRVVAQERNGAVVRFAPALPPARGRKRTPVPAEAGPVDPRSDRLLRPRADRFPPDGARVMVWIDLGPTKGVEVNPDRITLAVDGASIAPNPRWWRVGSTPNDCYDIGDPDGSARPSAVPFKVDGVAWLQLYYPVAELPRRELVVRVGGIAQLGRKPMSADLRFVRSE